MAFFKSWKGRNWQIIVSSSFASHELIFSSFASFELILSTAAGGAIISIANGQFLQYQVESWLWTKKIEAGYKVSLFSSTPLKLHSGAFFFSRGTVWQSLPMIIWLPLIYVGMLMHPTQGTYVALFGLSWCALVWSSAEQATDRTLWMERDLTRLFGQNVQTLLWDGTTVSFLRYKLELGLSLDRIYNALWAKQWK